MGGLAATGLTLATRSSAAGRQGPDLSHPTPEPHAEYKALPNERFTVRGEQALAEWERLKAAGRGWPVVIGGDEDLERITEQAAMGDPALVAAPSPGRDVRSSAQILAAADKIRFPQDLRKWPGTYRPEDLRAPLGAWPAKTDGGDPGLSVALDLVSGKFHDRVHILLLPIENSWEAPAYLRWGDWNACPPPEYHVAALRTWNARFGAELVGINGDTMNLRVKTRPGDRKQSLALARALYGYCPDIVDQGVGSLTGLAAGLMASDWWYLWWD